MSTKKDILKWLHDNLSSILTFPVPEDLTEYLLTIENDRDIEEYLRTLLDYSEPSHRQFVQNFKQIRHGANQDKGYRKDDDGNDDVMRYKISDNKKKKGVLSFNISNPEPVKDSDDFNQSYENDPPAKKESSNKKKTKYVNLYSPEGEGKDVVMLKGRHHCDCQASKHRLINNCMKCGRIVCAQEGSGPCIFCGNLVCSKEEQDFINTNTKQSQKLYQNLMMTGKPEGWEKAMEQRDRLLEYDRTSQRRTKVIDDEGEYFSTSSVWLSPAERSKMAQKEEVARQRKHASRLEKKVTLDFAGRCIVEEQPEEFGEEFYREALDEMDSSLGGGNVHPGIKLTDQPVFVESRKPSNRAPAAREDKGSDVVQHRIQDKEYLEMADCGACLSMHQPWASLLVAGVKRHEGRTWYSAHRGRLWIAAASKVPTEDDVMEVENMHRAFYPDEKVQFPASYPTSCLLGCVTVVDCLPQEEYRTRYPNGESQSPFVFICTEAKELKLRFPISGRHKIYKLDNVIHHAALKALHRLVLTDS